VELKHVYASWGYKLKPIYGAGEMNEGDKGRKSFDVTGCDSAPEAL